MVLQIKNVISPVRKLARQLRGGLYLQNAKIFMGKEIYRVDDRDTLDVDLSGNIGMGALLAYALRLHEFADQIDKQATIVSTSRLYGTGHDVFSQYFDRPEPKSGWKPYNSLVNEWLLLRAAPWTMSIERGHQLFRTHFRPKPAVEEHIAELCDLSIHFRGTDKVVESGIVPQDKMFDMIARFAPDRGRGTSIFLATDEPRFAMAVRERFDLARITSFDLGRVEEGEARHFSKLAPQDKALEALVNIFRIANARICLRTSSYLSAISRIINPALRTYTINTSRFSTIFPEDQILKFEKQKVFAARDGDSC